MHEGQNRQKPNPCINYYTFIALCYYSCRIFFRQYIINDSMYNNGLIQHKNFRAFVYIFSLFKRGDELVSFIGKIGI